MGVIGQFLIVAPEAIQTYNALCKLTFSIKEKKPQKNIFGKTPKMLINGLTGPQKPFETKHKIRKTIFRMKALG